MSEVFGKLITVEEAAESPRTSRDMIRHQPRVDVLSEGRKVDRQWWTDLEQMQQHLATGHEVKSPENQTNYELGEPGESGLVVFDFGREGEYA